MTTKLLPDWLAESEVGKAALAEVAERDFQQRKGLVQQIGLLKRQLAECEQNQQATLEVAQQEVREAEQVLQTRRNALQDLTGQYEGTRLDLGQQIARLRADLLNTAPPAISEAIDQVQARASKLAAEAKDARPEGTQEMERLRSARRQLETLKPMVLTSEELNARIDEVLAGILI